MKKTKFEIPSTIGKCADRLYQLREKRYAIQHEADELENQEKAIKAHLINILPSDSATGVSGKQANVQVVCERVPKAEDWDVLTAHIKKTGSFELLQKRLNSEAVRERWEAGKVVPGVGALTVKKVSVTKL